MRWDTTGRGVRHAVAVAVGVVLGVSACGTTDDASRETLPPLFTTTSSTIPPTTAPEEAERLFYEIERGDSLAEIARRFEVPLQAIIELNGIENPDTIAAGITIEIPTGVRLVEDLPEGTTTTSTEP